MTARRKSQPARLRKSVAARRRPTIPRPTREPWWAEYVFAMFVVHAFVGRSAPVSEYALPLLLCAMRGGEFRLHGLVISVPRRSR